MISEIKKKWEIHILLPLIYIMLVWVMLLSVFLVPCYGAEVKDGESRVFDYAGLFSSEEIAVMEEETGRLREKHKTEFIVLTVDDARNQATQEIADGFYFSYGFDKSFDESGAVVLIDMDNREIYLGTYGIMIRIITDRRLESILDAAYSDAARGNYASAVLTMLKECETYIQKGIVAGQYNYHSETGRIQMHHTVRWYEALVALAVSAVTAGLACSGVYRSYRMRGKDGESSYLAYQENCRIHTQPSVDRLLNTTLHHTIIRRQNTGGRSASGSSSRRSTTHSYHGHSAGGGGRKF